MKQALVCVSFGTTVENGRADLLAVESALQAEAPERYFARALTSRMIRKRLAAHGEEVKACRKCWKNCLLMELPMWLCSPHTCFTGMNTIK